MTLEEAGDDPFGCVDRGVLQVAHGESDIPYQTLINLCLRDCATHNRHLDLRWRPSQTGAVPVTTRNWNTFSATTKVLGNGAT
jgi:hypothetical protein